MRILVSVADQMLVLFDGDEQVLRSYPVSTARNGVGEESGSLCTPRGRHIVRAKIGAGCPENTVFMARRPTGELFSQELAAQFPDRDWILGRILWLSGCELGRNRLGNVDTMRRYIYIHGCPESTSIGEPVSHGCIRMRKADVIDLFDRIPVYSSVSIDEGCLPGSLLAPGTGRFAQ